ncbi:hypothetical protein [Mariniblastus fucicola]|nr:hypothetical protein [Mariniblastus fucicola]
MTTQHARTAPSWYVLFYQLYGPAWWIGTGLIAGSWFNIASPTVGWIGFGLACAASLGAYVLPSLAGVKPEDFVVLDSRMLNSKGEAYSDALERFSNGATLMYDGVAFGFRPDNEIACGVVAQSSDINETEAREIADHAETVFDTLTASSPEFASAVAGQTFRISIKSGMDANATELFRVVDRSIESRS